MTRQRVPLLLVVAAILVGGAGAAWLLLRAVGPAGAAGPPTFVDETAATGIGHRYTGPARFQVGGGVAVLDCDGDGRQDLYLAGGEAPAALYRNVSPAGGALRFEQLVSSTTDVEGVNGAYPIDFDGDGLADLAVLRIGETILLRGRGNCAFERANEDVGLAGLDGHTTAFSATWEGTAQRPTLAFGRYLTLDANGETTFDCDVGALFRPAADGQGYDPPIGLAPGFCALSMLFSDWDGSGRRDLRVTNDRQYYRDGMDQLWRIEAGVPPRPYDASDGWVSMQIWGMGIASRDLTGDGLPEVYLTSQGDNKLQTLTAGPAHPTFRDIALRRGVNSAQPYAGGEAMPSTAWHPEFADVNNDGYVDLLVTKGNVGAQDGYATRDPNDLFLGQPDGTFIQAADRAGLLRYERGRGAALADLNLDGLLDLVVVNYEADAVLWRNVGSGTAEAPAAMGHWLLLDIEQPGANRDAIGAKLEIRAGERVEMRELTIGGGHAGGQLGWTHIGLGTATTAEIRVTWPDGEVGPWLKVEADTRSIVERGEAAVRPWQVPGG